MNWKSAFEKFLQSKIPQARPWSIAEMGLSQEDYQNLIAAFEAMERYHWESAQTVSVESRDSSGLFLIAVLSEHARRHTRGAQIWRCMADLPMTKGLRQLFFPANSTGQPGRELKDAVESASYRWNLRHVFDIPGHKDWMVTLFLQFGFPLPAARKSIPFWLSGQAVAVSASYLLGSLRSPSFDSMWTALRSYRRNQIPEGRCRALLEQSPWVLGEWIPELLHLAKTRLDLPDSNGRTEETELDPLILGDPCLFWPSDEQPIFRCVVLAATTFELEEACYEIRSEHFDPIRIVRQDEGVYHVVGGGSVDIPLAQADVQCSIVALSAGTGEEEIATQSLTLWDRNYPISLFRKSTGRKMKDPEQPERLDEGGFAVFHNSFSITPQPVRAFSHRLWWFAELPACRPNEPSLIQNGERVWWPEETTERIRRETFPVDIRPRPSQMLHWTTQNEPPSVRFGIDLPDGAEMRWVRLGHEVVDYKNEGLGQYRTAPFSLQPGHLIHPFYATVGFSAGGQCHRVTQRVFLNIQACILEWEGKVSIYQPDRSLNVRNARHFLFHILTPNSDNQGEDPYWIQEGSRPIRSIGNRAVSLSDLSGYGEALYLHKNLYNSLHDPTVLAAKVRDNGALKSVRFGRDAPNGFVIETSSPIDLDQNHELVLWTMDHQFLRIALNRLTAREPRKWFCDLTEFQNELGRIPFIKAVGFFYNGIRIGNWFDNTYHLVITKLQDQNSDQAARCAEMLRWFKAPILDPDVAGAMIFLLRRYPGEVLPIFLTNDHSPELDLPALPLDDEWLRVVSMLCRSAGFGGLQLPDAAQIIEQVYPDFDPGNLEKSLPAGLARLEGVSANLIAKIAHLYLTEQLNQKSPGNYNTTKSAVLARFLVNQTEFSQLCEKLSIHPNFVQIMFERMVKSQQALDRRSARNCDLLLNHRLMRRLLTYLYLSKL
jgi:hypothetical protein